MLCRIYVVFCRISALSDLCLYIRMYMYDFLFMLCRIYALSDRQTGSNVYHWFLNCKRVDVGPESQWLVMRLGAMLQ